VEQIAPNAAPALGHVKTDAIEGDAITIALAPS
jgi:hypothetical protein